jgi:hypothetical protein
MGMRNQVVEGVKSIQKKIQKNKFKKTPKGYYFNFLRAGWEVRINR